MNTDSHLAAGDSLGSAAAILRPPLVLWLIVEAAWGLHGQLAGLLPEESGIAPLFLLSTLCYLAIAVFAVVYVRRDPEAARVFAPPRPRTVEFCVVVGLVSSLLLSMWQSLPYSDDSGQWGPGESGSGWPVWLSLVATAVTPAIYEEFMYRGLFLQRFTQVFGWPFANTFQAVLFATMHFDSWAMLPHFAFGLVAGVLRRSAGALWPCILFHFLWNGHVVLRSYGLWHSLLRMLHLA
ncbi:MAG: CPBP family intramembrane metalloprotease [Planctomycetes bacterium]|nr:CPBP family intramembrane metalloprotease [Planctomycetota bacterium]